MEFEVGISNYVLGNLRTDQLPQLAVEALETGYDTPALRILAGLRDNDWEINEYLGLTLKEMNIKLPVEKEAGLILIRYYLQQVTERKMAPVMGLGKIINKVLRKTSCFNGKDIEYAYDYIGFDSLYGLYYDYDDLKNPAVLLSESYRNDCKIEVLTNIIEESEKYLNNFDAIRNRILKG